MHLLSLHMCYEFEYRISANSFRGNYYFSEVGVRQLFKGGNYSREETINFLRLLLHAKNVEMEKKSIDIA